MAERAVAVEEILHLRVTVDEVLQRLLDGFARGIEDQVLHAVDGRIDAGKALMRPGVGENVEPDAEAEGELGIIERGLEQPLAKRFRERAVLPADELFVRRVPLEPRQEMERHPDLEISLARDVVPDVLRRIADTDALRQRLFFRLVREWIVIHIVIHELGTRGDNLGIRAPEVRPAGKHVHGAEMVIDVHSLFLSGGVLASLHFIRTGFANASQALWQSCTTCGHSGILLLSQSDSNSTGEHHRCRPAASA